MAGATEREREAPLLITINVINPLMSSVRAKSGGRGTANAGGQKLLESEKTARCAAGVFSDPEQQICLTRSNILDLNSCLEGHVIARDMILFVVSARTMKR